jgi:pyruvate dehydrogenase E2 component (dihydrolipoamide acetyltransferase)
VAGSVEAGPRLLRTVPLSGMRGAIARRMTESLQGSAQLTLNSELDARPLVAYRGQLRERSEYAEVTYNDLIVLAVARTLPAHQRLNATLEGNAISIWESINLGIAVSLDEGLMVPVISECGEKTLAEMAAASRELAGRARQGRLTMPEVLGGTFTVSNLGAFGVDHFTPIVNPPQVAILGVGRIRNGERLTLSLTIDHRAVDGAQGGHFLSALATALEKPATLTL